MDLFTTTASSWKALLSSSLSSSPPPLPAHYKIKKTSQSDALHDKDPSSSSSLIFSRSESSPPQERMTKPSSSLLLYKATTSLSSSSQSPSDSNGSSSSCSPCGTTPTHDDRDDEEDCHDPALPTRTRTTTTTRTTTLHHARLDGSLQCCQCHASHALYLMYPIVKTFETWNLENQYLCALCHDDDEDDNAKANDNAKDEQGRRLHAQEQEDPLHTPHGRSTPLWAHTNSSSSSNNNSKKKQPEQGKHQPLFLLTASSSSSSAALPPTHDGDRRRPTQIPLISQDSCDVQECLDLLHEVEEEREKAMERCTPLAIEELQHVMRQELLHLPPTSYVAHSHSRSRKMSSSSSSALSASASIQSIVDRDTKIYMDLWQRHWDLLAETVVVLQHALEVQGDDACDIVLAYYQWRSRPHPSRPLEETPKRRRGVTGTPPTTTTEPAWKLTADQALNQRDIEAGVGPGHFWGSSSSLSTTTPVSRATTVERPRDMESDTIEELASPEESLFIQLFVSHNRGLGWNTTNTCRPEADSSVAVSEAYASEANVKVVPRSEYFDRDLTKQEHAQDVQTLLVRVAEKKMATTTTTTTTTSPLAAMVVSSPHPLEQKESQQQQQQHSQERPPPYPMVTPTPVTTVPLLLLSRSRMTRKHPCPTEDDEDFPPPRNVRKIHRTKKGSSPNKVTDYSHRTSNSNSSITSALVDIASTPKQRVARIPSETNNKRVLSSEHTVDRDTSTASKRGKNVPIVSAIKASPKKTVDRGTPPPNEWIGTSTGATTSTRQRVPVTTTEPTTTKRRPGRPRKYPKKDDTVSTTTKTKKKSDTPMSPLVAEKVVTWSPIISAPPGTPASCTRSVENRRKSMTFHDEGDEVGGRGYDINFAGMNCSRAPRRCLRCVQFGGRMALVCKGRGGQRNCIYFNSNGKPAEN